MCRRVRMRCTVCKQEYQIHEVASELDKETEEILERYTSIIYDWPYYTGESPYLLLSIHSGSSTVIDRSPAPPQQTSL